MSSEPSTPSTLDRLMESFLERRWRGERPSVDEYARAHPELADEIREVFAALAVMEELGSAAGPATGPYAPLGDRPGVPGQLGDYRILREVGRGGMGVVYEALQGSLGRHVALKVLPPACLTDGSFLERFRREARAAARLHHSNIVPVFGVGEHESVHFYAMQYIRGQTLDAVLQELRRVCPGGLPSPAVPPAGLSEASRCFLVGRGGPSSPPAGGGDGGQSTLQSSGYGRIGYFCNVAELGARVADALAYAHSQGVVHRDVKPSNLMLDLDGTVWVTDFGLAKVEDEADLTRPGDALGTLRYMAPEQLAGRADARSDVYSLGITLYELATLRQAFESPLRAELIDAIRFRDPPAPRARERLVPRDLETIILKSTAKEPERRYQTAAELAEDLRRFGEDRPISARSAGRLERGWRWCRRNPALATALGAFVLTLLAGSAVASYLAVLAGERANAAERSASAALASEERAGEALEVAERTLVESLLQPLGHGGEGPSAVELAALEKLAGLASDEVRLRFLTAGLASPENARRVGLRAEPVVRAVVGLDRGRKQAAEKVLLHRLREPRLPRDVVLACLALAAALHCEDEQLADLGTRLLLEQTKRPNTIVRERAGPTGLVRQTVTFVDSSALQRALAAADGLTGALSPARADERVGDVLAALVDRTAETAPRAAAPAASPDEVSIAGLGAILQSLLKRLPPGEAARRADTAFTLLLTTARRSALRGRTVAGAGLSVDQVDYAVRMRLAAELAAWLTADQASRQAPAVVAEMRNSAADPEKGVLLSNKSEAVRWLAVALRPLLARLPAGQAEKHAGEGAELLLSAWKQEPAVSRRTDLAAAAGSLAPYLPARSIAALAYALVELLAKTADARDAAVLAGAVLEVQAKLPAEQGAAKAEQAAESVITVLLAQLEAAGQAAAKGAPRQAPRFARLDRTEGPAPITRLAAELKGLWQRLPPDKAADQATRVVKALVPAFLAAEEGDESSPLYKALQAIAERVPSEEAEKLIAPRVTMGRAKGPEGVRPGTSPRGLLVAIALADRLPPRSLLIAFNDGSLSPNAWRHLPLLQRRAEAASGDVADQFFVALLGLPRASARPFGPQGVSLTAPPGLLKSLAGRVSIAEVPKHGDAILRRMTNSPSEPELHALAGALGVLLGRLPPDQANGPAEQAARALTSAVCKVRAAARAGGFGRGQPATAALDEPLRALGARLTAAQAEQHVKALLDALGQARHVNDLCRVARSIHALSDRLPAEEGAKALARAAGALQLELVKAQSIAEFARLAASLGRMPPAAGELTEAHALAARKLAAKAKRGYELPPLAEASSVILAGFPAAAAAKHAAALADEMVQLAGRTKSPLDLLALAGSMRSIGRHLPPGGKQPEALADRLYQAWDEAPEEILTGQVGDAIVAIAGVLRPPAAAGAADRALTALKRADPRDRAALAEAHEALIKRLPEGWAAPRRVEAVQACLQAEAVRADRPWQGGPADSGSPPAAPAYLSPLLAACGPRDLIDVLRSPACTGDRQAWILAELRLRWRCEFRSVWDAVKRLEGSGAPNGSIAPSK